MLSFSEYVASLLGDTWRGQAPIGRRGMSAIFGSAAVVQDDRPEEPDTIILFTAPSANGGSRASTERVMCVVAALAGRLEGIRVVPCVCIPEEITAEYVELGGDIAAFDEAGIVYDAVVSGKDSDAGADFGMVLFDPEDGREIATVEIGDTVSLESLFRAAHQVVAHVVKDGAAHASIPEVVGEISAETLRWVANLFEVNQRALVYRKGLDLSLVAEVIEPTRAETLVVIASILTVVEWFEVVDLEQLAGIVMSLPWWHVAVDWAAASLTLRGGVRLAIELLEAAVGHSEPAPVSTWLALARVYGAAQRSDLAIATLQSALASHPQNPALLRTYGQQLSQSVDFDVLDESAFDDESVPVKTEALEALERSLRLSTDRQDRLASLYLLVQCAAEMTDEAVWYYFGLLCTEDNSGRLVDLALSSLLIRDDFERAAAHAKRATETHPEVARVWKNYAFAAYHAGWLADGKAAADRAAELAQSGAERGEAQLIAAYCESRGAEQFFSELADRVALGREASERDLEFLEWLVEAAPDYLEGYIVLARAYANQDEPSTALEVLLEAHERIGDIPQLLVELVDLLVEDGDLSVALDYIERALSTDPQHVPSLVRAARVTYLLDDLEGAKVFLRQAHSLSPYNQEVIQLTREIASDNSD